MIFPSLFSLLVPPSSLFDLPPGSSLLPKGLDTPEPVLQLDSYVFRGTYEDAVGSVLVFKEDGEILMLYYMRKDQV